MSTISWVNKTFGVFIMTSKVTGEGDDDEGEVPKKTLQFSAINSDF